MFKTPLLETMSRTKEPSIEMEVGESERSLAEVAVPVEAELDESEEIEIRLLASHSPDNGSSSVSQGNKGKDLRLPSSSSPHDNGKPANGQQLYSELVKLERKSKFPVSSAFLTLILSLFNLLWGLGLTYWHFQRNNFGVAVTSFAIIALSGAITSIAFFTCGSRQRNKSCSRSNIPTAPGPSPPPPADYSARRELWRCCKVSWLLAAIPCLVPVILASAYFLSSVREKGAEWSGSSSSSTTAIAAKPAFGDHKGRASTPCSSARWLAASGSFFLLESLTLCFPLCVLHLTVLMEHPDWMPSVIGLYTLPGLFILSVSITFSRFQYDRLYKPDRFGEGTEKYLRFTYLWSAKIIWLVTFSILIVTVRLVYVGREIPATAGAVAVLTAMHEIPIWICLLPACGKLAAKLSGLFFLIPQFTSLISLIYWVNMDPLIYHTNIGSIVLGIYFWSEAVVLCGWLADGNADKDVDLVPLYPHFFGDLISSCVPDQR